MKNLYFILILWLTYACATNNARDEQDAEDIGSADTTIVVDTRIPVKLQRVQKGDFVMQILTNGQITAARQVEIRVRSSGLIKELPIKAGDYVRRDALLCRQDQEELQLQLEQYELELASALIKVDEALILQGGQAGDTSSVSPEVLHTIRVTAGYAAAVHQIKQAKYQLGRTRTYAPFAGLVTGLAVQQYQDVPAGEPLCTLVDPGSYEVTFTVLERDAHRIEIGQHLVFSTQAAKTHEYRAQIYRIDPVIDEQGLLTARARVIGSSGGLYTGMKASVIVEDVVQDQLFVPKEALVLRSNREVIFVADTTEGLAKWKYVTTGQRNDQGISIVEGLEPDDLIIVEGNLNLAHDAEIRIEE